MTTATGLVQAQTLTLRYGRKRALDQASLTVPEGSVTALLGRNGAGKSSLLQCLLGQIPPDTGQALLFGQPAWTHRVAAMARIGVVPEVPDLPPTMSADQAAAFSAPLYPGWDRAGFSARLARFQIPGQVPAGHLSRGQQTQVGLALALASRPELLILDDPTLGLDPVARHGFYQELVEELAERPLTVLVASHDLHGLEAIATRIGLLHQGRMLLEDDLEPVKQRFRRIQAHPDLPEAALAGLTPIRVQRSSLGLSAVVADFSEAGLAQAGLPAEAATALSLEDLFITLTTDTPEITS